MRSPFTTTPSASIASTRLFTRTSTPSASSEARANADIRSANCGRTRGPFCTSRMRAEAGSKLRNSFSMPCRASSAIAPASSTPVGPAPQMRKVSRVFRTSSSSVASACSKAPMIRLRMFVAHWLEYWRMCQKCNNRSLTASDPAAVFKATSLGSALLAKPPQLTR